MEYKNEIEAEELGGVVFFVYKSHYLIYTKRSYIKQTGKHRLIFIDSIKQKTPTHI